MERGGFSTRLGFILVSAGCAIGLGNVWRFPYITGQYSGASFVLIYLLFLAIMIIYIILGACVGFCAAALLQGGR